MNVHGPDLNFQTKETGGTFCLTYSMLYVQGGFMHTARLNIPSPWKFKTDIAAWGAKWFVRTPVPLLLSLCNIPMKAEE